MIWEIISAILITGLGLCCIASFIWAVNQTMDDLADRVAKKIKDEELKRK